MIIQFYPHSLSVCGRTHLGSIAASAGSFVYGFGATISGYASDNYGRKATIMVALILNISFHLASTFATSYPLYLALYWLAGNSHQEKCCAGNKGE